MQKLYYGGNIIAMTGEHDMPEALLVTDHKIAYAGPKAGAEKLSGPDTEYIDLNRKTLMPAFLDGHGHVSMAAQMALNADLSGCGSYRDVINTLNQYIAERHISVNDIVVGFGYDHNFLKEGGHPTRQILDQVSESIPIYVSHASGHMGCANSAALKLAGIGSNTADPQGGVIGRIPGTKEPDGRSRND